MDLPLISKTFIENNIVLLRVDFNISFNKSHQIANTERITQSLPTIELLLKHHNKIRILTHLGRPKGHDSTLSLKPVAELLQTLLPKYKIVFVDDFFSQKTKMILDTQIANQIILFDNVRFEVGEEKNDLEFAKKLSSLGEIYVNDAFSDSHRNHASIVGIPNFLPAYAGLQFEKEIHAVDTLLSEPQRPFVTIIGGAKIDKINLIQKLATICDTLLIGGKFIEYLENNHEAMRNLQSKTHIIMPTDYVYEKDEIADIGPNSIALFETHIRGAKTIFWNGPMGKTENLEFQNGTRAVLDAIADNTSAYSIVGGGDTIVAIEHDKHKNAISHLSTAGGALIAYIENGTLPGIEALKAH